MLVPSTFTTSQYCLGLLSVVPHVHRFIFFVCWAGEGDQGVGGGGPHLGKLGGEAYPQLVRVRWSGRGLVFCTGS
jgi:hypothetical protein